MLDAGRHKQHDALAVEVFSVEFYCYLALVIPSHFGKTAGRTHVHAQWVFNDDFLIDKKQKFYDNIDFLRIRWFGLINRLKYGICKL